jgi:hypothetical protein
MRFAFTGQRQIRHFSVFAALYAGMITTVVRVCGGYHRSDEIGKTLLLLIRYIAWCIFPNRECHYRLASSINTPSEVIFIS